MPPQPSRRALPLAATALACLVACLGLATAAAAEEPRLDLTITPSGKVGLKELLQVTVTVESVGRVDVSRPDLKTHQLRLLSGPNQSTSVRFINGVSSQTLGYTWIAQPMALGTARIYDASVVVDGQQLQLPERQVEVVENPPERESRRRRDPFDVFSRDPFFDDADRLFDSRRRRRPAPKPPRLFLEAEVEPKRPRVGEQAIYRLYLYFDVNVRNATPANLPDFKGFWSRVVPQPERTRQERLVREGREIYRAILLERALFPRRAGRLEIEPVEATMTAMVPDSSPFGSLMPRMSEIESTSNAVTLDVRPLPEPQPEGFQGLVGRLGLDLRVDRTELEVGQAATLTATLEGEGHLQSVPAPDLGDIEGVQVMAPQQQSEETLEGDRVHGKRVWQWVLVPQRPGQHRVPALEIPYFDPRRGEYRVASTDPVTLDVSGTSRLSTGGGQEVTLHPVRTANTPPVATGSWLTASSRHWLIFLPAFLGCLVMALRRRASGPGASRAGGRRQLRQALAEAAGEDRPRQAAARIEDAWRAYLEEKWEIPRGTPTPRWAEILEQRGVRPDTAGELVQLADDLHYLRYAPKLSSTSEMRDELIERSRRLAGSL